MALGASQVIKNKVPGSLEALQQSLDDKLDWYFGYLGYDLKNEIEHLHSNKPDHLQFPDLWFFIPRIVIEIKGAEGNALFHAESTSIDDVKKIINLIDRIKLKTIQNSQPINLKPRINREDYLRKIKALQDHIARGDIYEINFCQEFFAEHACIEPEASFLNLLHVSPTPFSSYLKLNDACVLSASPERFFKKTGGNLVSQPIKGTIKRGSNPSEDNELARALANNIKEQSENVMIVDLVRNDLSRLAVKGSVKVDELFGIYAFPQVYQMISTISAIMPHSVKFTQLLRQLFPMGSMTGAPKVRAMQLIEKYEETRRGVFSGAIGYITPEGNADFNVVIRTILYHAQKQYLSCSVGSAITALADPEKEYEECLLKLSAMEKALHRK